MGQGVGVGVGVGVRGRVGVLVRVRVQVGGWTCRQWMNCDVYLGQKSENARGSTRASSG